MCMAFYEFIKTQTVGAAFFLNSKVICDILILPESSKNNHK